MQCNSASEANNAVQLLPLSGYDAVICLLNTNHLVDPPINNRTVLPQRQHIKGLLHPCSNVLDAEKKEGDYHRNWWRGNRAQQGVESKRQPTTPHTQETSGELAVWRVDGCSQDPLTAAEHVLHQRHTPVQLHADDRVQCAPHGVS